MILEYPARIKLEPLPAQLERDRVLFAVTTRVQKATGSAIQRKEIREPLHSYKNSPSLSLLFWISLGVYALFMAVGLFRLLVRFNFGFRPVS